MLLIPLGRISKVHGRRCEIKIVPFSRRSDSFLKVKRLYIKKSPHEEPTEYIVSKVRSQNSSSIIQLRDVHTFEEAKRLTGSIVMADKDDLPGLQENEYYAYQLIGLKVLTNEGSYIGRATNIIERDPQHILVVENEGREFLIPMVDTIVREINLGESIIIYPLPGLLD